MLPRLQLQQTEAMLALHQSVCTNSVAHMGMQAGADVASLHPLTFSWLFRMQPGWQGAAAVDA